MVKITNLTTQQKEELNNIDKTLIRINVIKKFCNRKELSEIEKTWIKVHVLGDLI